MTQQPSGGQPWPPAGQQPWDAGRQQPQPQPQHQRPLPPPMPQAFAAPQRDNITRLGIWRLAIGIWLGGMLLFITMIILALVIGATLGSQFQSDFGTSNSDSGFNFN